MIPLRNHIIPVMSRSIQIYPDEKSTTWAGNIHIQLCQTNWATAFKLAFPLRFDGKLQRVCQNKNLFAFICLLLLYIPHSILMTPFPFTSPNAWTLLANLQFHISVIWIFSKIGILLGYVWILAYNFWCG